MFLPLLLLFSVWQTSHVTPAQDENKVVDRFIAAQARKQKGEEPDNIRKSITGDLNHDGLEDTAVLYTIEGQGGSNNYIQFLAVFLKTKRGLVYAANEPVGGKNHRAAELISITDGMVNLNILGYGPKDPSCCPTIEGTTRYALMGHALKERRSSKKP